MKKVAVIQSNYIPWKGYFDIIHDVDLFIFYDDVQFTKNDWRNRNKIKTAQGIIWLTIPVGKNLDRLICEVELPDKDWRRRHWDTIKQAYSKTPYFGMYKGFLEHVYIDMEWSNLSVLNQFLIEHISRDFLGIRTEFKDSREFQPQGEKLNRLMDLLKKADASLYVSGPSAQAYIEEPVFQDAGIKLFYKDYSGYPEYRQSFPPFEHGVSILDMLFNCGPSAPDLIWGWRENVAFENKQALRIT
jgi:hypothetical protein